jgi:hypothetical protein
LESGKLDLVVANSKGKLGGKRALAHSFTATPDRMPTFMHLGAFAAQPRQVTFVARTKCLIWLLERAAVRAVLGRRLWDVLPHLRRVNLLACLSLGQLDRVLATMQRRMFQPNEIIVKKGGETKFGIVAKGQVRFSEATMLAVCAIVAAALFAAELGDLFLILSLCASASHEHSAHTDRSKDH